MANLAHECVSLVAVLDEPLALEHDVVPSVMGSCEQHHQNKVHLASGHLQLPCQLHRLSRAAHDANSDENHCIQHHPHPLCAGDAAASIPGAGWEAMGAPAQTTAPEAVAGVTCLSDAIASLLAGG
mmetsp:Transcript_143564/g.400176  ORF Transcript_143564/g.400176 Transcript_143564/m.400176 type:complete len:126 (-) Transcript_143564:188-565(-)